MGTMKATHPSREVLLDLVTRLALNACQCDQFPGCWTCQARELLRMSRRSGSTLGVPVKTTTARPVRRPAETLTHKKVGALTVTLRRSTTDRTHGVKTFYVSSLRGLIGVEYTLKLVRRIVRGKDYRAVTCTCPDFVNRAQPRGLACKHINLLREFLRTIGGAKHVPLGTRLEVEVTEGRTS